MSTQKVHTYFFFLLKHDFQILKKKWEKNDRKKDLFCNIESSITRPIKEFIQKLIGFKTHDSKSFAKSKEICFPLCWVFFFKLNFIGHALIRQSILFYHLYPTPRWVNKANSYSYSNSVGKAINNQFFCGVGTKFLCLLSPYLKQ